MNMKVILGVVGLVVVVVVVGWYVSLRRAAVQWEGPVQEIAREKMEKTGDTWHIEFETMFDATVDRVYEAYSQPERGHEFAPDQVLASELKSSSGNTKVVELRARVLNLPIQRLIIEYTLDPERKRLTSRTLEYNMADITSEYEFQASPDGKRTLLKFKQTSKEKLGNPLPESVQKGALKASYVTAVRTVNKALGISPSP